MNKLGKGLLVASLAMGVAQADTYTNKTFLATRPVGVNLAMEGTTWHTQIHHPKAMDGNKFGASFEIVGFYEESQNDSNIGKYFGFNDKNKLVVGNGNTSGVDIDKRNLLHDPLAIRNFSGTNLGNIGVTFTNPFSGNINLKFDRQAAGVNLVYQQDLDGLMDGMYFKVRAPIAWEEMRNKSTFTSLVTATVNSDYGTTGGGTILAFLSGSNSSTVDLRNYFNGTLVLTDTNNFNKQDGLTAAKFDGNKSKTSLADIDVLFGWSFYETEDNHAGINVGVTIPTSSEPNGEYAWEAQSGNRGHWALGGGLDAKFKAWAKEEQCLEVDVVLDWRYLLKDNEKRTLGIKGKKWGQYFLLGQDQVRGVFPAANVLTRRVSVRPGNQVDARFGLAYRSGNFTLDAGYNLFARESERVDLSDLINESSYGIAGNNYKPWDATYSVGATAGNGVFSASSIAAASHTIDTTAAITGNASTPFLKNSDLDTLPASTPSTVTHKIYGGLGWAWNNWDTPVMIGAGAAYEFASTQKALENWMFWAKVGVSF